MLYTPCMKTSSPVYSRPIEISASTESQTYLLFALAMGLTVVGVYCGTLFAEAIYGSGMHFVLLIAQLAIVFSAPLWVERTPLNYLLFALFPIFSGLAITPFIHGVVLGYENGPAILINSLGATATMSLAAAVFAKTTDWNLGFLSRGLFFAVLGLIALSILQIFVPSMRTSGFELVLSGAGTVIFALFTAYDVQRISQMSRMGANAFGLALSLYLDIFNLFLYILRFMIALSGDRR